MDNIRYSETTVEQLSQLVEILDDIPIDSIVAILHWIEKDHNKFIYFENDKRGGWHFPSRTDREWAGR